MSCPGCGEPVVGEPYFYVTEFRDDLMVGVLAHQRCGHEETQTHWVLGPA